ncbi:MAG: glycine cleavage system protein GcvH [Syntrophomonadaceae bacterium]
MKIPEDLLYSREHEWIRIEGDIGSIGITDYAQHHLGDIVFVELPDLDLEVDQGDPLVVIESVKAVASIFSPAAGTVTAVNEELETSPELLNEDPYENWIARIEISDAGIRQDLMSAQDYAAFCQSQED